MVRWNLLLVVFVLLAAVGSGDQVLSDRELSGRWEELPLPAAEDPQLHEMAMEPGGTIWIMANGGLYYWDGSAFVPPVSGQLASGQTPTGLYGGPDRVLYATQKNDKYHWGKLYRLSDGEARYVTDYYYEMTDGRPGLYVSKTGKLYNWGNRFLAVYSDGEWQRIEAKLNSRYTLVFDTGQTVHFYYNEKLYSADGDDNLAEHDLAVPVRTVSQSHPSRIRVHGALWRLVWGSQYRGNRHRVHPTSVGAGSSGRDPYSLDQRGKGNGPPAGSGGRNLCRDLFRGECRRGATSSRASRAESHSSHHYC